MSLIDDFFIKIGRFADRSKFIFPVLAIVISTVTLLPIVDELISGKRLGFEKRLEAVKNETDIQSTINDVLILKLKVSDISSELKKVTENNPDFGKNLEIVTLINQISDVDGRLESIEKVILDSPEKALSLPLIRKEQDSILKNIESSKVAYKVEMDRLYEQQKFMLGGIGAVLLAVIGWALSLISKAYLKADD